MKSKKKVKKIWKYVLYVIILLGAMAGILQWRYASAKKKDEEAAVTATPEPTPSAVTYLNDVDEDPSGEYILDDATIQSLRDEIAQDKAINADVKGILYFESGLVHKPVLQGTDNSYYLYHQWETGEYGNTENGVMLDAENNLDRDEMNLIMYGHYWYMSYDPVHRDYGFTALSNLIDQANYESNKYLVFVTENEIRYYEIARVFACPLVHNGDLDYPVDNMLYNMTSYDSAYFASYLDAIQQYQYYDTGVELNYGDHLLTLQTCIDNNNDAHEVVLCRELGRNSFN